jgi:hypothetical protein
MMQLINNIYLIYREVEEQKVEFNTLNGKDDQLE